MKIGELKSILKDRLRNQRPFVTYSKPGSNSLVTWLCDDAKFENSFDLSQPGFIFSSFDPDFDSVLFPLRKSRVIRTPMEPLDWIPSDNEKGSDAMSVDGPERDRHIELVRKAVDEIRSGKAEKIVISRMEEIQDTPLDPVIVFLRLVSLYPHAYSYIWYHPKVGLWTGASPETLVEVEDKSFFTMSLAGTQRYVEHEEAVWGEKELEEQRMVTDLIQKELGSMLEHVGKPINQRAGNLLHLRTDIHGHLHEDKMLSDLIKRLHPTAAICGLPRKEALAFIHSNEGYSREFYTGFLGEIHHPVSGSAHLFVNLRCMQLFPKEKKVRIYVGGGITSSSDPEREWEETRAKSETMKRVFS